MADLRAIVIDKGIMVYVYGTKVDFANAAILAFTGRDFAGIAFFPFSSAQRVSLSKIDRYYIPRR